MELFLQLSAVLAIALLISLLMRLLKQPLIVGYMLTGLVIGPSVFRLLNDSLVVSTFSNIGTTILLFIIGLNLRPQFVRDVGKTAVFAGLAQIGVTMVLAFGLSRGLSFALLPSLYVAAALTFSSTIVILKLLSDKGDLEKLHAKLSVGILLLQDIAASVVLVLISSFTNVSIQTYGFTTAVEFIAIKIAVLAFILIALGKYVIPQLMKFIAGSTELLFLFSIAFGMGMSALFYSFGISLEVGALVAGVMLSTTLYENEIASRLRPLGDFFTVLFFVALGSQIVLGDIPRMWLPAATLFVFVVLIKPLIVFIVMNLLGYSKRVGFLSAISTGQISEFSLVLIALGLQLSQINRDEFSLVTLVGLTSIVVSTYLISRDRPIYSRLAGILGALQIRKKPTVLRAENPNHYDAMLFGYHRVGQDFVQAFKQLGTSYVVIDFDPATVERLSSRKIPYIYGDAEDIEFLNDLDFKHAQLIVSTIPDHETNILLVRHIRKHNKDAIVLIFSNNVREAKKLYDSQATYVFMPHYLGAQYAADMIVHHSLRPEKYEHEREKHLKYLSRRMAQA